MEYSDLYESKKNAHKLQMAKVKYMQSRLNDDDRIFRMTSVVEIIDALIEKLERKNSYVDTPMMMMEVAEPGLYENSYLSESSGKISEKDRKEIERLKKAKEEYLNSPGNFISDFIIKKEQETGLYGPEVYSRVGMGKDTYSNLRSNRNINPKFETCVQLILLHSPRRIGLQLLLSPSL